MSNVAAALAAVDALQGAEKRIADIEGIPVAVMPATMQARVLKEAIDLADARATAPRRRKGTATHQEFDSFILHVNRFKDADSVIFADNDNTSLTAVLDYHTAAGPRWGEHQSVYECPKSRQWALWMSKNGCQFDQEKFGEFIDANMRDLASPSAGGAVSVDIAEPAAVLQMARNLVVQTKGEFSRIINPTTGEGSLIVKDEHGPQSTKVPRAFLLQLPVFENGTVYAVEARIRFAMNGGRPTFAYVLYEPEKIVQDAFGEVRTKATTGTALPLFVGSPESWDDE
jgi:uncharacterized protein YfdQ (DUF2303 family)